MTYPVVAPVRLPDTSMLGSGAAALSDELSSLDTADMAGLDIVSPSCDAKGNLAAAAPDIFELAEVEEYLNLDGGAHVKLKTDKDGTKHYTDLGGSKNLSMTVRRDGSGKITDLGGNRNLNVTINKDGSGTLTDLGGSANLNITVKADGSGEYVELGGSSNLSVTVAADGTGRLTDLGGDRHLTIDIPAAGRATMTDLGGDENLTVTVAGDGSGSLTDLGGDRNVKLAVGSNGSLRMTDLGGSKHLDVTLKPDRSGSYQDLAGDVTFGFGPDGRATDGSGYVIELPPNPVFAAPDRFPPLGRLGRLTPPCATVLRFAADVLFDFDQATLKPDAKELIAKAAGVLAAAGKPVQVDGHTDAKGTDAYNIDLSVRRAEAFAAGLRASVPDLGITTKGWGESRPVAPNTTADGKDNPAGRALNRRVEVVLKN